MTSNEKMQKLAQRYHDNSLSRAERREAYKALELERYRADNRKPMSLRLYTFLWSVVELVLGVFWLLSGVGIKITLPTSFDDIIGEYIWVPMFSIAIICVILNLNYKKPLKDELSSQNMAKANLAGFIIGLAVLWIARIAYFMFSGNNTLVLSDIASERLLLGLFAFIRSIIGFVFIILDFKDTLSGADDDCVEAE